MKLISRKMALPLLSFALTIGMIGGSQAYADAKCEKTVGGKKSEFTGDSLDGLVVDKKSMASLNKKYPQLSITEKVFTGAVQTCTDCKDNYVSCTE